MNETEKAFEHYLYCVRCTAHQDPRFTICLCCGGKMVSAQHSVQADEVPQCDCNSAQGFHEVSCAQTIYYAALRR